MKKITAIMFLLFPLVSLAQQDMMAQMQEMSQCMQSIDQNEMKVLEQNSKQFQIEVTTLCENDKRSEAQEKAIEFSKQMMDSNVMKSMNKCLEKMPASMQGMMPDMNPDELIKDFSKHHVCDEI